MKGSNDLGQTGLVRELLPIAETHSRVERKARKSPSGSQSFLKRDADSFHQKRFTPLFRVFIPLLAAKVDKTELHFLSLVVESTLRRRVSSSACPGALSSSGLQPFAAVFNKALSVQLSTRTLDEFLTNSSHKTDRAGPPSETQPVPFCLFKMC